MKQHMMTHKLRDMPPHMFGAGGQPLSGLSPHNHQSDATNLSSSSSSLNDTKDGVQTQQQQQQQPIPPPHHHSSIRVKSESELSPRLIDCRTTSSGSSASVVGGGNTAVDRNSHDRINNNHNERSAVERRHDQPPPPSSSSSQMMNHNNNISDRHHHQLQQQQQHHHHNQMERERQERQAAAERMDRHDRGDRHEMLDGARSFMPPHFAAAADHVAGYQHVMMMAERERQIKSESRLKRSPSDIQQPSPKRTFGKFFFLIILLHKYYCGFTFYCVST